MSRECENSTKRSSKNIRTQYLSPGMRIDITNAHIDPLILFTRLTAILQRETDSVENFNYELTPETVSLFKEGIMRKPQKAVLRYV